jgi:ribosomal protein L6P/L9E
MFANLIKRSIRRKVNNNNNNNNNKNNKNISDDFWLGALSGYISGMIVAASIGYKANLKI